MDELVEFAAEPLGYLGSVLILIGVIWLGVSLGKGMRGGELLRSLALIMAGGVVTAFATAYGFNG